MQAGPAAGQIGGYRVSRDRRDVTVSNQTPVSSLASHIFGGPVPAGPSRQGERQREHRPGIAVGPI
jgi:hypothetical protein